MADEQRAFWVALHRVEGLGPKRFQRILQEWGGPHIAWEKDRKELEAVLGAKVTERLLELRRTIDPTRLMQQLRAEEISVITWQDEDYPANLQRIDNPPPVLYYRGRWSPQDVNAVAVVGSRNPTPTGAYIAEELALALGQQGITVVSGLARGIDTAAHWGAVRGGGRTIAVLGSGLDELYPPENRSLGEEIQKNGLLISEFPLGTKPVAGNFPSRNRIISGLSLGVLVVEAAKDSGSLITANLALEQGREVFAVPGPIYSMVSKGANRLIQQGAHLVQDVGDILNALQLTKITAEQLAAVRREQLAPAEERILAVLGEGPRHIDLVIRDSGLPASEVASTLVTLELKGLIRSGAGRTYCRLR
ncbi:MAG TPA: DNA-protecting protein DprA [Firmicutes bacterium]|jgi:DNA processing protein|nr:DNA-protecting protein DprA [Bacillota bacterium]HOQ23589.1 DNA-processing protein DprA [Bacillota bacterium]HPT67238.1 DNA-processing protein DprA [Bacillota bacterium]